MFKAQTQYELNMWLSALRKVVDAENSKNPSAAPHKRNVLQKLFKRRKSALADSDRSLKTAVFGIDMADLKTGTPAYLQEWYDYLSAHGLDVTGVFRKPGENNLIKRLSSMYARGEKVDLVKEVGGYTEAAVHCVASLLKLFFRESQVPLFPEVRKDFIAEVDKQVDEANVIFLLGKVVSEFSKSRQNIIKDLFLFLHKVTLNSEENLMTPNALAVCLTPSLFQTGAFQTLEDLQALKPLTAVTTKFIQFADKISFAGRRASVCQLPMSHVSEATAAPRARSLSSLPPRTVSGFTDVSKEAVHRPKSTMYASKSKYKTNPDPKSEFVGKPHTKSESAKDPHPTTESKPRKQTPRPKSATESEIHVDSKEKLSKPRPLSSSDIVSERARKIKEKLAAAGWESKKTGDGRVFYFHRAEQRSSWSADGIVNSWIQVQSKGKIYYYHSHTHERRWDKPEDFDG
jgi:hypothetical protein